MNKKRPTAPVKSSTQEFVEIEAVKDDVLMLKDKSCSIIIRCGAVNFALLSEEEQQSMIYAFAALLNSLNFPVQICILSKRMDISSYVDFLEGKIQKQQDPILNKRLTAYANFIKNMVKRNIILEKYFYFVVPFSPLELGSSGAKASLLKKEYVFVRAKASLYPKRDHLLRLIKRIGLTGHCLYEQEIIEVFYNLYNTSLSGKKLGPIKNYTDIILTT